MAVLLALLVMSAVNAARADSFAGGNNVFATDYPWQAWVQLNDGTDDFYCGGTILDTKHVVTAAHCLFRTTGTPFTPSQIAVTTGISAFDPVTWFTDPQAGDSEQSANVSAERVHPYFTWNASPSTEQDVADDIAVLTLSSPLVFDAATSAISLPAAGTPLNVGAVATATGFGAQDAQTAVGDGKLRALDFTVEDPFEATDDSNALWIAATGDGSSCNGDSGGALVTSSSSGVLSGIVSHGSGCIAFSDNYFVNVAAPEVLDFLNGDDSPPMAPRGGTEVSISATSYVQPGSLLKCNTGAWSGAPAFTFVFVDGVSHRTLQIGSSSQYSPTSSDLGAQISCVATATNAGGSGRGASPQSYVVNPSASAETTLDSQDFALSILRVKRTGPKTLSGLVRVQNVAAFLASSVRVCAHVSRGLKFSHSQNGGLISSKGANECWLANSLRPSKDLKLKFELTRARQKPHKKLAAAIDLSVTSANSNSATLRKELAK